MCRTARRSTSRRGTLFAGPGAGIVARARAEGRLAPDAPLRRWRLIEMPDAARGALAPIALDERIADFLLGRDRLDPRAAARARRIEPAPVPPSQAVRIAGFAARLAEGAPRAVIVGPEGSGRRAAALAVAGALGLGLAEWRTDAPPEGAMPDDPDGFGLMAREALMGGFAWLIDAGVPASAPSALARRALARLEGPLIVIANEPPGDDAGDVPDAPVLRLPPLSEADRAALLGAGLPAGAGRDAAARAAAQFRIGPQAIARILRTDPAPAALWQACREACAAGLDGLARRVEPRFGWDDLILPDPVLAALRALAAQARQRATVMDRWGFGRAWQGTGASALLAGPSGTGKSMAAEVIARDLGVDQGAMTDRRHGGDTGVTVVVTDVIARLGGQGDLGAALARLGPGQAEAALARAIAEAARRDGVAGLGAAEARAAARAVLRQLARAPAGPAR